MLVWRWADVSIFDEPVTRRLFQGLVNGLAPGRWSWPPGRPGDRGRRLGPGCALSAIATIAGRAAGRPGLGLAAGLIGAGPAIINFFYGAGLKVH